MQTRGSDQPAQVVRIAGCAVDFAAGEILRDGKVVRATPKVAQTLAVLSESAGEVVTKQEILDRVWPEIHVTENGLWSSIAELRRIFEDDPRQPRVIETLPRRGYRLIAPVERGERRARQTPAATPHRSRSMAQALRGALRQARRLPRAARGVLLAATIVSAATWAVLAGLEYGSRAPTNSILERGLDAYQRNTPDFNERAIELLEAAVDSQPADARSRAALADAYARKALDYSVEPWWRERALDEARAAVELDPDLAAAHAALGRARSVCGDPEGARRAYRRAIEIRPGHAPALNSLGVLQLHTGALIRATTLLQRAVAKAPDDPAYLVNLGTSLRLLGLPSRARSMLEKVVAPPDSIAAAELAWQMALLDLERGAREAARRQLAAARELAPRSRELLLHSAELALILDRPRQTLAFLAEIKRTRRGPTDLRRLMLLDAVGSEVGERLSEAARRVLAESPATARRNADRSRHLAIAHTALGQRRQAVEWLGRSIDAGYRDRFLLGLDPVFATIRDAPGFSDILQRLDILLEAERQAFLIRSWDS